jgi:tripartite-type tricarboxylate transporter receptor subunit TctC
LIDLSRIVPNAMVKSEAKYCFVQPLTSVKDFRWNWRRLGCPRHAAPAWFWRLLLCLVVLPVVVGCGSQSEFPSQPIVLICPWSPGGGTDRVSRQVATQLSESLGVPVNVVNATGGGGVTGHTRGAVARPDGYTLTMATVELNMLHWRGLTTISPDDFEPLALCNRDAAAIFVRNDSPWQTLADLESTIAKEPGKLRASGSARGSIWHVALAGWLLEQGLPADATAWVSINGSGPSLQELLAGGVELICCSVPEARGLLTGGELRCLGVMADSRHPLAPNVPTFREAGCDWALGGWRGLMLPLGVPEERATVIREAVLETVESDAFAQFMETAGFNLTIGEPDAFEQLLATFDATFGEIFATAEIDAVSESPIGPYGFPLILVSVGACLLVLLVGRGQLQLQTDALRLTWRDLPRLLLVPVAVGFFMLTTETLGFVIAATGMLLGLLLVVRVHLLTATVITLLLVPAVYQFFAVQLGVPLPWGILGW